MSTGWDDVQELKEQLAPPPKTAGQRFGELLAPMLAGTVAGALVITYIGFLVWFWNLTMGWAT